MKTLFLLGYPCLYSFIQVIIIFLFTLFFNHSISASSGYISTVEYQMRLSDFLIEQKALMALISFFLCFPIFYRCLKKTEYKKPGKPSISAFFLGCSFATFYNYILGIFQISTQPITSYIYSFLISTVFLAPILEELIFRGIIFEKLKKRMNVKQAILLQAFLFSIFHFTLIQFIYTFFFGILLGIIAQKKGIYSSILAHMSSNFISFLFPFLFAFSPWYFPFFLFLISCVFLFSKKNPLFP